MPEEIDIQLDLHADEVNHLLRQLRALSPAPVGELLRGALENAFAQGRDASAQVRIVIGAGRAPEA
ncbi:MAG: hypothetical protein HYZ26_03415 [Chloroflexi bacterium]|nr:hypothetical protein [Chloroflexota bacterium]